MPSKRRLVNAKEVIIVIIVGEWLTVGRESGHLCRLLTLKTVKNQISNAWLLG